MTGKPLRGQVAIVTGASGGLGRAISRRLVQDGARVTVHFGQSKDAAMDLLSELNQDGNNSIALPADISTTSGCEALIRNAEKALGTASILVNNAAIQPVAELGEILAADFQRMMATNVEGPFRLTQLFADRITSRERGRASIVNIASIEGLRPAYNHSHYAISKSAIIMLSKASALELGRKGIRVNTVSPGLINRDGLKRDWPDGVERWQSSAPLGRLGRAEDVAGAVSFLASPDAEWITGHNLIVDGGISVHPSW